MLPAPAGSGAGLLALLVLLAGGAGDAAAVGGDGESFRGDFGAEEIAYFKGEVRPLLEANCFKCHGGSDGRGEVKVRGGLQLISRRGVLTGGDHGPAVDLAAPESSKLLEMVSYKDDDHQMPPAGKLGAGELAVLEKWVRMGAPWTPEDADVLLHIEEEAAHTEVNDTTMAFWSYRPMVRPEVPEVGNPEWSRHPVDAFLIAGLDEAGLAPNPPAPKRELARRAYYNLTGLPPSPAALEAFVSDPSPDAWPRLLDRLLDSPAYGEKWARHWLDVVRYAESNGFERDSEKEYIWRYRDYVVDAFNSDKPYDQFLREQLAGDEMENPTPASRIATGYHRLMQWDDEPADPLQHRYDVLDDNVRTTSEAMLGMTLGCARCHDHKGDPIPQEDYYRFMAIFHGVTQHSKRGVLEEVDLPPEADDIAAWKDRSGQRIEELERELARLGRSAAAKLRSLDPEAFHDQGGTESLVADARRGGEAAWWDYTTVDPGSGWSDVGFRPSDGWANGEAPFGTRAAKPASKTPWDTPEIWMQTTFRLTEIPDEARLHVFHDGPAEVYLNGQLVFEGQGPSAGEHTAVPLGPAGMGALQTGRNVVAVHCEAGGGMAAVDVGLESGRGGLDPDALVARRGSELLDPADLGRYREAAAERDALRTAAGPRGVAAMVVQEAGPHPPPLHVHIRGNASAPGSPVEPGFPAIFGGADAAVPVPREDGRTSGRRLALADWITAPDNPRTARVMANRIWQHHFGRGLCPSPNDFGYLGERPTHPELLDWLATEFVARGWSIKEMHRLLMLSEAYQMSSRGRDDALAKDPQNNLFWRFDMRRLAAEEIRDSMLLVSGRLNREMGGPGVFVPLPEAVLATSSKGAGMWGVSPEEDARRRSLYVAVKRSLKPPEFTDFDFADTDSSCPVRFATTVPTQALHMLNSEFINDQASGFAKRLRADHPGDVPAQVRNGLGLALGRPPDDAEVAHCLDFIRAVTAEHGVAPDRALERFCLLALNLNEFIYLD